jgi:hypothetical protein
MIYKATLSRYNFEPVFKPFAIQLWSAKEHFPSILVRLPKYLSLSQKYS